MCLGLLTSPDMDNYMKYMNTYISSYTYSKQFVTFHLCTYVFSYSHLSLMIFMLNVNPQHSHLFISVISHRQVLLSFVAHLWQSRDTRKSVVSARFCPATQDCKLHGQRLRVVLGRSLLSELPGPSRLVREDLWRCRNQASTTKAPGTVTFIGPSSLGSNRHYCLLDHYHLSYRSCGPTFEFSTVLVARS